MLKDYYQILELAPSASHEEIKKAYRKLAHLHHPDKNGNDPYAVARFSEIKEAYETLTNPLRKDIYLQNRWYAQSMGKKASAFVVSPVSILKQVLELDRYSNKLDIHRMDKEGLYQYIIYILSDENIKKLSEFNEPDTNREIILFAIKSGRLLPYPFVLKLADRLQTIPVTDITVAEKIKEFVNESRINVYWEKRRLWIVAIIVLLISAGIFLIAKK